MNWRSSPWPAFVLFLVLVIALHAYLGRYAHPIADDLTYALKGASASTWAAASWEYAHWNGRYASNFLVLNGPLRWGFDAINLYRLIPGLLLALTFAGAWILLRTVGRPNLPHAHAAIAALIWTVLYTHLMPDMPEGFYWYTGSITYQLPSALTLVACALLLRASVDTWHVARTTALALLFFIVGCNEVIMLLMVVVGLLLLRSALRGERRTTALTWSAVAVILAGAAIMILAPGNEGRGSLFPDRHRLLPSLGMSALQTGRFFLEWASCPALLLLSMLWWTNHRRFAERTPLIALGFGLRPWASLTLLFGSIFLCVFPAYWSTGILGQHRTVNVACLFFLPLWFMNLSVFAARFAGSRLRLHDTDRRRLTVALLLLTALDIGFTGNSGDAITDLLTGRAARADAQFRDRYDRLRDAALRPDRTAYLPLIEDPPKSIHVIDLRDPYFLVNADYALWFGLKEVRTVQSDEAKTTN